MIILSPICPHFCEHVWELLGMKSFVRNGRWPTPAAAIDQAVVNQGTYMYDQVPRNLIQIQLRAEKAGKSTAATVIGQYSVVL